MFRSVIVKSISRPTATRSFHASPAACKTVIETVKDTAHKVNVKVGQTLASGIEKGEQATQATKETIGVKTDEVKESVEKTTEQAKQKGNQAAAGAREAKADFQKELRK